MLQLRSLRTLIALGFIACAAVVTTMPVRAAVPTAPTNLSYTLSGQTATLTWTASANAPTSYVLQAGASSGTTFYQVNVGNTTVVAASAPPGTYYVRIVAVNADGTSAPSNEIVVTITCAPSVPRNFRIMQKGTEAFLFWRAPTSGAPNGYAIQAGLGPGQTLAAFSVPSNTPFMNANVGSGTYYVRLFATSGCGNSPATADVPVTFPTNTTRVADPTPGSGTLGMPYVRGLVERFAASDRPTGANTCPTGRKYEPNPWQDRLVAFLRTYDTRFGYNSKPTRTSVDNGGFPVIAAGDEISFFVGSGTAEGSSDVVTIDVLFGHCGTTDPTIDYRDISPEPSKWTGAGRFSGDEK